MTSVPIDVFDGRVALLQVSQAERLVLRNPKDRENLFRCCGKANQMLLVVPSLMSSFKNMNDR